MNIRARFIGAAATGLACALVLPVVFGDAPANQLRDGEDAWRTVIYDFQTLIGGILAVGAAWLTIMTMEATDRAAQVRHAEQLDLIVRPQRLAIERALIPQLAQLRNIHAYFADLSQEFRDAENDTAANEILFKKANGIIQWAQMLTDTVGRKQLVDAEPLLGGELTYWLSTVRVDAPKLESATSRAIGRGIRADEFNFPIYNGIHNLGVILPVIIKDLESLGETYGVHV